MTEHTLKNVIKRTLLQSEGGYTLAFQGGEPTLCGLDFFRQAIRYIHQYNKNHCHIQIALQTNGYGITEEWARFFAGNHFLLGVSVDGLKEIHNTYRHAVDGGDSYQHCMKTIRLFEKYGVEYNILTVVHREIAENIRNIYREYKNNGTNGNICSLSPVWIRSECLADRRNILYCPKCMVGFWWTFLRYGLRI